MEERDSLSWVRDGFISIKHVNLLFQRFLTGARESKECGCSLSLSGCSVLCFLQKDGTCNFSWLLVCF